jgi:hypothetical protein
MALSMNYRTLLNPPALTKRAERIRKQFQARSTGTPILKAIRRDPAQILTLAGLTPDPWQRDVLLSTDEDRIMMLASRQVGKTFTAAAVALWEMLTRRDALVLVLSPTLRQSKEFFRRKMLPLWHKLGDPLKAKPPIALEMELTNGSRVVALPDSEEGIRGFSNVNLLVIDEASRVSDELYHSVRPMLATSKGRLIVLSTPFGQQGWFYEAWTGPERWKRVAVTAKMCPRISPEFLAEERRSKGAKWFSMEYELAFLGLAGSVFDPEDIDAALRDGGDYLVLS